MKNETKAIDIINQQDIRELQAKFRAVEKFRAAVRQLLVKGADYGEIAGNTVLFKSGAEKIIWILGLKAEFEIIHSITDVDNGFFAYTVKCKLKKGDEVITEGLGHANTREQNRIRRDPYTEANAVLKMAEKRAMVDAALHAGVLSEIFTQDLEDITPQAVQHNNVNYQQNNNTAVQDKRLITDKQRKRLWAIAEMDKELIKEVLDEFGYKHTRDITREDYDAIIDKIKERKEKIKQFHKTLDEDKEFQKIVEEIQEWTESITERKD